MIHPIRFAKSAYGPKPSFAECDFARFLWLLREGKRASREKIAASLQIGEGSVRTIIRELKLTGLIEVRRRGCALTRKGRGALRELEVRDARFVPATELSYNKKAFAIVFSSCESAANGFAWRDEAVKAGANGATMLSLKQGKFILPIKEYRVRHEDEKKILSALKTEDGDAVVLAYAESRLASERGAWTAALFLSKR